MKRVVMMVLLAGTLLSVGCTRLFEMTSRVIDVQPDEAGNAARTEHIYVYKMALGGPDFTLKQVTEFYADGRPSMIVVESDEMEDVALEFYPDGQLKSEKRYDGDEIRFATTYDEQGNLTETTGTRLTECEQQVLERAVEDGKQREGRRG